LIPGFGNIRAGPGNFIFHRSKSSAVSVHHASFYPAVTEAVSAGIFPVFSAFLLHFCESVVF